MMQRMRIRVISNVVRIFDIFWPANQLMNPGSSGLLRRLNDSSLRKAYLKLLPRNLKVSICG